MHYFRVMFRQALLSLLAVAVCQAVFASSEAESEVPEGEAPSDPVLAVRGASAEELVGFWRQVAVMGSGERDLAGLYYSGQQFWEFFPDGGVRIIVFEKVVPTEAELIAIRQRGPKHTKWALLPGLPGLLQLTYPNGSNYIVMATYYPQDVAVNRPQVSGRGQAAAPETPKAGDITLTYLDLATFTPVYFRLLRRLGDPIEPIFGPWSDGYLPEPLPVDDDPVMRKIKEESLRGRNPLDRFY